MKRITVIMLCTVLPSFLISQSANRLQNSNNNWSPSEMKLLASVRTPSFFSVDPYHDRTIATESVTANGFQNSKNWRSNRKEFFVAIGPTQFLGDVGGRDQIGTTKSLADLNIKSTRMGGGLGYRIRFHPRFATTSMLYFGMLSGDDAFTKEKARNSRNLSFRSPLLELGQRFEVIIYADEASGSAVLRGGERVKSDVVYAFTGISGIFFQPQAKIDGKWTNLRPLKTEGQGLPGGASPYSNFNASIPFGLGFKLGITDILKLGLEVSYHKTFTDYIDDVSTVYYDPNALEAEFGPLSRRAANPSVKNPSWFGEGEKRGNPDENDAYFLVNVTATFKIGGGAGRMQWRRN